MYSIDLNIFNYIHQLVGKSRLLDLLAIFFADYFGYIVILISVFLIFSSKKAKDIFYKISFISLAVILSRGIFTETIRFFWFKNRPFVDGNFIPLIEKSAEAASFPSGNMAFFFALAFAIYFLGHKKWSYLFMIGFLFMGVSRVYAGVHWPLDIVFGIVIAFISAFIVKLLLEPKKY